MLAAYYGHADTVKLLIQHGADPNRLNDKRQSPIAGAVFKGLDAVIEVSENVGAIAWDSPIMKHEGNVDATDTGACG